MPKYKVLGLFQGAQQTLSNGQASAIKKSPVTSFFIDFDQIPGDEVVDQKHHGGEMRVLHHYSKINYDHLKSMFPDIADRFQPGQYGENLYTEELTESELCVGDIFTLGKAKVQLTVPRRPCATINASFDDNRILTEVIKSGHVGWFYKTLDTGIVQVGDDLELLERPNPKLIISKLFDQGYRAPLFGDKDFLKACYETGLMDKGWKPKLDRIFS